MATHLLETEIAKIKRESLVIDEDGSGKISANELTSISKDPKLKMSREDVDDLMKDTDIDENGTIDICEFMLIALLLYVL